MVKVSLGEYINIYKTSFFISTLLSSAIILINFSPSLFYSICMSLLYVILFIIFIFKSRDKVDIEKVMQTLGVKKKYTDFIHKHF